MATEKTLIGGACEEHLAMFHQRILRPSRGFCFILVLSCVLFFLPTCWPCATSSHVESDADGKIESLEYDACGSYGDNYGKEVQDLLGGSIGSKFIGESSATCSGIRTVCGSSELFCFPSTLSGFSDEVDKCKAILREVSENYDDNTSPQSPVTYSVEESTSSRSSERETFVLSDGVVVSCSPNAGVELHHESSTESSNEIRDLCASCGGSSHKYNMPYAKSDKNYEESKSDVQDGSSAPRVDINPPSLDWGQNYLYYPSTAFLTVANRGTDSILHIYEPFSSDPQFYPCNFNEVVLGPDEVASICFTFLPRHLGLSSAHIVLQTSSGGFLVHAKGLAVESLYKIESLTGVDAHSDVGWSKNLSLHNPFDDTLHVKEVVAWVSVHLENTSHSAEVVCKLNKPQGSEQFRPSVETSQWLDIKSSLDGFPLMGIRPHHGWNIDPQSTGNFMEIDFLSGVQRRVFGMFCLKLESSSQERIDTVIIPLDAQVHSTSSYISQGPISVSLESLVPCDGGGKISVVLSLRNGASYLSSVVKISEDTEDKQLFQIKYIDGFLLFPGTITPVAVVAYIPGLPGDSKEPIHEIPDVSSNCRLLISTNDSVSPLIKIPCQDIVNTCARPQVPSSIGSELQPDESKSRNAITGSLSNVVQSSHVKLKELEVAKADELVLRKWRSQGSSSDMSILDDDELQFPVVQIGNYGSKWIAVKNPSSEPVTMQLIMNSGEIVDECRAADKLPLSSSLVQNETTRPTRYGFSIASNAITEAYVHPNGRAFLGPIVFHPSKRCRWRGSAVIRNNLSGVESLPLQGSGGSFSLVLLEGFEVVQSLEFNLSMRSPYSLSSPEMSDQISNKKTSLCSQPFSKELVAKNTGDLSLEIRRIEVSGSDCGLDGFTVKTCSVFSLEPGESRKLLISYRPEFSGSVVHRDLELSLANGIHVIPMKATIPAYMLSQCGTSTIWICVKQFLIGTFMFVSILLLVFAVAQVMMIMNSLNLFKPDNASISWERGSKQIDGGTRSFSICNYIGNILESVRGDETSKLGFAGRYSDGSNGVQEQKITAQLMKNVHDYDQVIGISALRDEVQSTFSLDAKPKTSGLFETEQTSSLTVRTGKEKGRRRRKKTPVAGLSGLLEVSSSQSGNSTPSSPLSPVASSTPKRVVHPSAENEHALDVAHKSRIKEPFLETGSGPKTFELDKPKVSVKHNRSNSIYAQPEPLVPRKAIGKPALLSSATFPARGCRVPGRAIPSPNLISSSPITPIARAPGSNLSKESRMKEEDKGNHQDKFTYDIWGNHFSGFHLVDKNNGGVSSSSMLSNPSSGGSQSFFARGPQMLMQKSQARSLSPDDNLPNAVSSL